VSDKFGSLTRKWISLVDARFISKQLPSAQLQLIHHPRLGTEPIASPRSILFGTRRRKTVKEPRRHRRQSTLP
jgi:hypothetical protein